MINAKVNKSTFRLKPAGLARKHCIYQKKDRLELKGKIFNCINF